MADMVKLNVGGVIYYTSMSTLKSCSGSSLSKMFSGEGDSYFTPPRMDDSGAYVIDSCPTMFEYVLNWCRYRRLVIANTQLDWDSLEAIADYFLLEDMKKAVIKRREAEIMKDKEKSDMLKKLVKAIQRNDSRLESHTEQVCQELKEMNEYLDAHNDKLQDIGSELYDLTSELKDLGSELYNQTSELKNIDYSMQAIQEELQEIKQQRESQSVDEEEP